MAYSKVVSSLLIALISSLMSCVQINAAVINSHNQYFYFFVTVSSSSTSSSVHLYVSAYFFLTFSEYLDIFLGDKLQASKVYTLQ